MPDEKYWREVLDGNRKGPLFDAARSALFGLEVVYAGGLGVYLAAEKVGLRAREHLGVPTISVGNLSVGGTGKTPMTQLIARKLQADGLRPAVLNRGHGGSLSPDATVVSNLDGTVVHTAAEAGDEAVLLARSLPGVPVVVGKDRRISGKLAVEQFDPGVIILDDGFQYWQLARDLDIVLLDATRPFDNGHALPRGLLREPKRNLARAGMVVFTRADGLDEGDRQRLRQRSNELTPSAPVFFASHRPAGLRPVNAAAKVGEPTRPLAVCAIAQPESFVRTLSETGIDVAGLIAFADHEPFADDQRTVIEQRIAEIGAGSVIVTEKDAVKMLEGYLDVPVYALGIEMLIDDESLFWETLRTRAGLTEQDHG